MENLKALEEIKNSELYIQVLTDSYGGVMYDVDKLAEYDQKEVERIVKLADSLPPNIVDKEGGIFKGVIDYLKGN